MDGEVAPALKEVVETGRWQTTSLETFAFHCDRREFSPDLWTFLEHFSGTLTALHTAIHIPDTGLSAFVQLVEELTATPRGFPFLRQLRLEGSIHSLQSQLALFRDSPITDLPLSVQAEQPYLTHPSPNSRHAFQDSRTLRWSPAFPPSS